MNRNMMTGIHTTLILDGWYADPEGRDCTFVLYCDEVAEVLPVFARYERPDVAKALEQFADIRRPGFTVKIADAWELAGRHQVLELFWNTAGRRYPYGK